MPPRPFPSLNNFSSRSLNLIASLFSNGRNVCVQLSGRLVPAMAIALESDTIVLNPERTGLYDLLLAARLLSCRPRRKTGPQDPAKLDRWLTRQAHRKWAPSAQQALASEFPGVRHLPGRFTPGASFEGLSMTDRQIEYTPLEACSLSRPGGLSELGFDSLPEPVEIVGAEGDTEFVLKSLESGAIATNFIAGFEELPIVRFPFTLSTTQSFALREVFEERVLNDPVVTKHIPDLMHCYMTKSSVREERNNQGRHIYSGGRLDPNRLLAARLVRRSRSGMPSPPLFRKKSQTFEPIWDPAQHCVVVCFDVNDLRNTGWQYEDPRYATHRMLAGILTMYQRLQTDTVVIGFADSLVNLPDGRTVLLHAKTVLKSIDEDFDDAFWHRVAQLLNQPPAFPGSPTCFHPASLADITETFEETAAWDSGTHAYHALVWWARRPGHHDFELYRSPSFVSRVADHVDHEMAELGRLLPQGIDAQASFLPHELKQSGRAGGYLSDCRF